MKRTSLKRSRSHVPFRALEMLESRVFLSAATANLFLNPPPAQTTLTGFTYGDGSGDFGGIFNSSGGSGASTFSGGILNIGPVPPAYVPPAPTPLTGSNVTNVPVVLTLSGPAEPAVAGTTITLTLTAVAADNASLDSAQVYVLDSADPDSTPTPHWATVTNGMATFSIPVLPGVHHYTAHIVYDVIDSIIPPNSGIIPGSLTISPGSLNLTGTSIPSGTGTITLSANSVPASASSFGWNTTQYHYTQYLGDSNTVEVAVPKVATTVTIFDLFSAKVTGDIDIAPKPTGSVNISADGHLLATINLGYYSSQLTLPPGLHNITAAYAGDDNYLPSDGTIQTTFTATTLTSDITAPTVDQSILLTARVAPDVAGTLTFQDGATLLGVQTLDHGTASFQVTHPTGGGHSFTAYFTPADATRVNPSFATLPLVVTYPQVINLLATYTKSAEQTYSDLLSLIEQSVAQANNTLSANHQATTIRLVGIVPLRGVESGQAYSDAAALNTPSDGNWDDVFAMRQRVGADAVALFAYGKAGGSSTAVAGASGVTEAPEDTVSTATMLRSLAWSAVAASPVPIGAVIPIGSVDTFTTSDIAGWMLDPKAFALPATIQITIDGQVTATFAADTERDDIRAAFGNGQHGFDYTIPTLTEGSHTLTVSALDATTGLAVQLATETMNYASPLFDETFYLQNNPDVAAAVNAGKITAWNHFLLAGQFEKRDPSAYFDTSLYLADNPDVATALADRQIPSAFSHYSTTGQFEDRTASVYFDPHFYRLANPDVDAALKTEHLSGILQFLLAGQSENRDPIPYFDSVQYSSGNANASPDGNVKLVPGVGIIPYHQFLQNGNASGLNPSLWFNEATYLALNPDVAAAVANHTVVSGLDHYLRTGRAEGRAFSYSFSESAYLESNPAVAAAVQDGQFTSGFEQFILVGQFQHHAA